MAARTITHFKVDALLFNDIVGILDQLPSRTSRQLLNRVEGGEVEPMFKIDIPKAPPKKPAKKPRAPKNASKKPRKKAPKRKAARKVAKKAGGS